MIYSNSIKEIADVAGSFCDESSREYHIESNPQDEQHRMLRVWQKLGLWFVNYYMHCDLALVRCSAMLVTLKIQSGYNSATEQSNSGALPASNQ